LTVGTGRKSINGTLGKKSNSPNAHTNGQRTGKDGEEKDPPWKRRHPFQRKKRKLVRTSRPGRQGGEKIKKGSHQELFELSELRDW